jgi:hypothetical protein
MEKFIAAGVAIMWPKCQEAIDKSVFPSTLPRVNRVKSIMESLRLIGGFWGKMSDSGWREEMFSHQRVESHDKSRHEKSLSSSRLVMQNCSRKSMQAWQEFTLDFLVCWSSQEFLCKNRLETFFDWEQLLPDNPLSSQTTKETWKIRKGRISKVTTATI